MKCNEVKPLSQFSKSNASLDKKMSICSECNRAHVKKWLKENPEKAKDKGLKKYGITYQQKLQMIENQHNKCACCGKTFTDTIDQHLDHCHTTGLIRGILCHACNIGIGYFKDSKEKLYRAYKYLDQYDRQTTATPVSDEYCWEVEQYPEHWVIPPAGPWEDGDDTYHHRGADARKDADHRAQTGSGNGVGRRNQKVETSD